MPSSDNSAESPSHEMLFFYGLFTVMAVSVLVAVFSKEPTEASPIKAEKASKKVKVQKDQ